MRFVVAVVLSLGFGQGAATAEMRHYTIDASASQVVIHVGKTGLFSFAGHEHDVVAPGLRGAARIDPDQMARSSVDISFDAAALRVIGNKGEPAKDVSEVQARMVGPKCLDVARFPSIRFVSKAVTPGPAVAGARELAIRGDLTLHGVTREITIPVRMTLDDHRFEATGTTTVRQKDFGITPISVAGVVKVKNDLPLRFRFVGRR